MSSFVVALLFGIGAGSFAWAQIARSTGNADPTKVTGSAAVVGLIVFLFLFSLFTWVLHL